jgi:hypothetical protein
MKPLLPFAFGTTFLTCIILAGTTTQAQIDKAINVAPGCGTWQSVTALDQVQRRYCELSMVLGKRIQLVDG